MGDIGDKPVMTDLEAIEQIRGILDEFYPDVRKAILEYCLFITEKDLEG